jgi:g-D-glutamyl-meso-diaminopimelate peptidase
MAVGLSLQNSSVVNSAGTIEYSIDGSKSQTISNFMTLCNAHRTVASYESIGKTLLGNNIWAFKFGNPNGGRVLWTAQLHGNEGMGTEIMWIWAQWLISNDTKAQQYMKTNYIMMVPVQNYDSYGRQNARRSYVLPNGTTINVPYGVNLNRNFPIGWGTYGSTNPADSGQNYMGLYAGSEPETQALTSATRTFKPKIHVDFHNWGAPLTAGYGDKSLITAISQTQQNYFNTVKPTYKGIPLTPYPLQYSGLAGGTWVCQTQGMNIGCTSILVELDPATDSQFRTGRYTACPVWAVQQYYYPKSKGLLLGTLDNTANSAE